MIYYININLDLEKKHPTSNALTEVIDHLYKSLDEGNYVFGIYIDLKKHLIQFNIRYPYTNSSTFEYVV